MAPPGAAITIGGKDFSLSPAAVYAVASGLVNARIDSAALDKLSQSKKFSLLPPPESTASQNPRTLTPEESRAALLVLLSKIIRPDATGIRPALPRLIEQTLNTPSGHETLDFSSSIALLNTLCALNGTKLHEIGVTRDEIGLIDSSSAASIGICAIVDCCSSVLARVLDAVAALSCEAARVQIVSAFDLPASGDVVRDMKELLLGSKLVGQVNSRLVAKIPSVHGGFCKDVKFLHGVIREELKSVVKIEKTDGEGNCDKEEALVGVVSLMAWSIRYMGKLSFNRARLVAESIADQDLRLKVVEVFEQSCPKFDALRNQLTQFHSIADEATSVSDYILAFHYVYDSLVKLRQILAWEAALALFALETDNSVEKIQSGPQASVNANEDNSKVEKKSKKGKKKTLGKGTSIIRQFLRDQLAYKNETSIGDVAILFEWARELALYFDPQDIGLEAFLEKVKEILESNEARRLPKIPKGTRDFGKEQMAIRERAFSIIQRIFKLHGATSLDTPVFELRETLMGKYGEDSKLIYDLADQIKLNHRKLLDGMLEICGVSSEKFRTVCSSIDKLDKQSFEQIKKELVEEKGLAVETADRIGTFVKKRGPPLEILSDLKKEGSQFLENDGSVLALNELEILFKALEESKCIHRVVFDLSLARGLDYYTGVIFEAVFKGTTQVGSIAAGGRYDNLVGMFSGKQVPAVGVSLGIERVFTIMEQLEKDRNQVIRATDTQVLVAVLGKDVPLAARLVGELWDAGIAAEYGLTKRVMNHINRAKQSGIPWIVIVGESEISAGIVKLKNIEANKEEEVPRERMVEELQRRMNLI